MSDTISRQAAIDAIEEYADRLQMVDWKENPGVPYKAYALNWCINTIRDLPSAQPETTRILAEALNGSPLLYPCDKLWSREGWCKDHCKKGQTEPDTECWLKYAETIAAERREE